MVPLIHCQDLVTLTNVLDRQSPDSQVARAWYRIPHTTTRTVHSWLELLDTTRASGQGKKYQEGVTDRTCSSVKAT